MFRPPRRHHLLQLAIAFVAGVVVVLLVLIGLGVLVLPASSPPKVTITEVQWTILQGTNPNGAGWFGKSPINETAADGLPWSVNSGGSANFLVQLLGNNRTIYNVTSLTPGFKVTSTIPPTPCNATGVDEFHITATVQVPSVSSDTSYVLELEINGLYPSGPP